MTRSNNNSHHLQLRLGDDVAISRLEPLNGIANKLVDNSPSRLLLVDNSSGLAHQEGSGVIHSLVIKVVTHLLEIVLDGDYTLAGELLDLVLPVLLPVGDVGVSPHAERTTSEDDSADIVVEAGSADSLLVSLRGASLISEDEAGTDPDTTGTEVKRSSDGLAVEDTAGGDDLHGLAGHGRLVALAELGDGGDEDRRGDVTRVATALAALGADDVGANVDALLHVLGVSDHVHVEDAVLVEAFDDVLGGNTDGGDEQLGARVDDDVDELVELALCVVVASSALAGVMWAVQTRRTYLVLRALPPTWGRRRSTPKGALLSFRYPFSSAICSRSMSGVYPTPPMTPIPPALVTAAASLGPAATFMPASRTGC